MRSVSFCKDYNRRMQPPMLDTLAELFGATDVQGVDGGALVALPCGKATAWGCGRNAPTTSGNG